MLIDNNPIISLDYNTLQVDDIIDANEEICVSINGIISLFKEDFERVQENTIYLKDNLDFNYSDDLVVFYTKGPRTI
jgi:hypothetical protein